MTHETSNKISNEITKWRNEESKLAIRPLETTEQWAIRLLMKVNELETKISILEANLKTLENQLTCEPTDPYPCKKETE